MSTAEISTSPRRDHVVAIVRTSGGEAFGHVVQRGIRYTASRKAGTPADVRRFANQFRSITAAVRWIESAAN